MKRRKQFKQSNLQGLIYPTYKFEEDRMTNHKFIKKLRKKLVKMFNPEPLLQRFDWSCNPHQTDMFGQ